MYTDQQYLLDNRLTDKVVFSFNFVDVTLNCTISQENIVSILSEVRRGGRPFLLNYN